MSKSKSKSSAVAEEKALAQGVKPLPDEQDPKGNRTASGTFARSNRANSASGEVFEQHSVVWKWDHGSEVRAEFIDPDLIPIAAGGSAADEKQDFVSYTIIVTRGEGPDAETWEIEKRYSQFVELNTKVKALSGISITLPPKKVFGNKSKEFVAKRREGLQAYLLQLLHHPILQHSLVLKEFVDFRRLFIRNQSEFSLDTKLGRFGWRYLKSSALVRSTSGPSVGAAHVLSWNPMQRLPAEESEEGELCPAGSLRDVICGVKEGAGTKLDFPKKYAAGAAASGSGLPAGDVKFLHDKKVATGHLHAGNVLINAAGQAALSDIENGLLGGGGVHGFYSPFTSKLGHVDTLQAQDVYCFAAQLIAQILGSDVKKMPTISSVLKDPFFAGGAVLAAKPSFKSSARVKEGLATQYAAIEAAFKAKQQLWDNSRKHVKLEGKRAKAKSGSSTQRSATKLTVKTSAAAAAAAAGGAFD
eukprot:gene2321-8419_t